MEAVCNPNANFPPEGGHVAEGICRGEKDFSAVEEGWPDEHLCKVARGPWVKAFAVFRKSPNFNPCCFSEGQALREVLLGGVVVL